MFDNRILLIATKHQQETVIGPLFKKSFDLNSKISVNFDTDSLGTFTGEVERINDPLSSINNQKIEKFETKPQLRTKSFAN